GSRGVLRGRFAAATGGQRKAQRHGQGHAGALAATTAGRARTHVLVCVVHLLVSPLCDLIQANAASPSREAAARMIVAMAPAVASGGSLADAEAGEDVAEQGIGIDPAGDAAQRIVRQSERLRGQFELTGIEPSPGISKLSLCLPQGLDMARPRGELAAAGVFPG